MIRFKTLTYFIKVINNPVNEPIAARFSFLNKDVNKIPVRFCSAEVVPEGKEQAKPSVLDPVEKLDLTEYGPVLSKNFNFSMVADKSPLVQKFIDLGVNLYEIEKNAEAAKFLLTLTFERIKPYLFFLTDNGVPSDKLGEFITKNPTIFKENLDDLEVRINYLKSKNFTSEMISTIITKYPKWLSIPVKQVDERLGYLQQIFQLKGHEVRSIITRVPSLSNVKKKFIAMNSHALKEEMNLDNFALKKMIVSEPQLLRIDTYDMISTYEYITKTMKVSKQLVVSQPKVLGCRKFLLQERHRFLESLGRAQYCHLLPGYVSLLSLVETSDDEFCEKIAKTSVDLYNNFLKTL